MLLATLASLVFQGRKREQEHKEKARNSPVEIVRNSPPTPTRVLSPPDLEFVEPAGGQATGIQNRGVDTYRNVMLRITYFDRGGRALGTRDRGFGAEVLPGQVSAVAEFDPPDAPTGWVRRDVRVLYAELAAGTRPEPRIDK